ncbi:G5 domain-containing protein [Micromonospora sp. NPDC050495]|uniref:G5 domain-containing protein n=1 Tax=Micromonospora sp. NPDC050495 TaxID=3154936 RepID=UPI0033DEE9EA
MAVIGAFTENPQQDGTTTTKKANERPAAAPIVEDATATEPTPEATTAAPSPSPSVATRTETERQSIRYAVRTVKDPDLTEGKRVVRTRGVNGVRTLTYEVTLIDGVPTGRRLVSSVITKRPVTQVVAVGTKRTSRCDPNYSGCVPIASDVDCAGGGGNGPAYVSGPIRVIGTDIYRLDRDGDGYGCDD